MNQQNVNKTFQINKAAAGRSMLLGAGIGLLLIALFLSGVDNPSPSWSRFWMLRPLIIVPLSGAAGGLFAHLIMHLRYRNALIKALAIPIAIIGFIVALWLGAVLGMDGTLWD